MTRIYDCFQFFNELEVLEIRLAELYDHVDHFVLVEARQSHDGNPKPLYFHQNRSRFKRWEDKIIHVVVDLPKLTLFDRALVKLSTIGSLYKITSKIVAFGFGRMKMDHSQRRQIVKGLVGIEDDDIIMVSDADEIPDTRLIRKAAAIAARGKAVCFKQDHFIYYLNGLVNRNAWAGTKMCTARYLRERLKGDLQTLRVPLGAIIKDRLFGIKEDIVLLDNAGWHFTYLGGWERVALKKRVFAHSEVSTGDDVSAAQIKRDMKRGVYRYKDSFEHRIHRVRIDRSFPAAIRKNPRRYRHLMMPKNGA